MNRLHILFTLSTQKKLKNYLEIGVFNGHIFFRIKSTFKVAVDPIFRFNVRRKLGKIMLNPFNLFNHYYQKKSDDFFEQDAPSLFKDKKIQLSLIDGMHEYEYVLRDIQNTLRYMDPQGVIVVHDCNPETKEAACSFSDWEKRQFTGTWNGDVWKAILHLRCLRNDVNAFVLDCDHGLGIITFGPPQDPLTYTKEQIANFTYEDFERNKHSWLNLKPATYFYSYFNIQKD